MLGIDINDTKVIEIEDAKFTIGVLPYNIKMRLSAMSIRLSQTKSKSVEGEFMTNPEETMKQQSDYVKYGVKGHENIKTRDGKVIEFKKNDDGTVSDETLGVYHSSNIMAKLFLEVFTFNTLTGEEQKN